MSKAKLDNIDGATYSVSNHGHNARRTARVSGLKSHAADRLNVAIKCAGIPRLGDPHPTIPGLFATTISAKPNGPADAIVTIEYESRSANRGGTATLNVGASVAQMSTNVDAAGQPIHVSYSPTGHSDDVRTQTGRVTKLMPQTTLRFSRTESASPLTKARHYVGSINRSAIFEGEAQTWLCTGIDGSSTDGGNSYEVTYTFQLNTQKWQPTVSYIDPNTRQPPTDLVEGVGVKHVNVYPETEFKELGL